MLSNVSTNDQTLNDNPFFPYFAVGAVLDAVFKYCQSSCAASLAFTQECNSSRLPTTRHQGLPLRPRPVQPPALPGCVPLHATSTAGNGGPIQRTHTSANQRAKNVFNKLSQDGEGAGKSLKVPRSVLIGEWQRFPRRDRQGAPEECCLMHTRFCTAARLRAHPKRRSRLRILDGPAKEERVDGFLTRGGYSPMTNRRRYSATRTAASGLILDPSAALSLLQCSCSSFFTTVGFMVTCG